jgi:hypothetical protein
MAVAGPGGWTLAGRSSGQGETDIRGERLQELLVRKRRGGEQTPCMRVRLEQEQAPGQGD